MSLLRSVPRATVCCLMVACVAPAALAVGSPEYSLAELQPLGCEKMFIKLNTGLESCDAQAFYSAGVLYYKCACLGRDPDKAAQVMRGALDARHPEAGEALAVMTGLGRGVLQDYAAAGALLNPAGVKLPGDGPPSNGPDADNTRGYAFTWLKVTDREFVYPSDMRPARIRGINSLRYDPSSGQWTVGTFLSVGGADNASTGSRIDRSRSAVAQALEEAARTTNELVPPADRSRMVAGAYNLQMTVLPIESDTASAADLMPLPGNMPRDRAPAGRPGGGR